jgi:hypothetical protein
MLIQLLLCLLVVAIAVGVIHFTEKQMTKGPGAKDPTQQLSKDGVSKKANGDAAADRTTTTAA